MSEVASAELCALVSRLVGEEPQLYDFLPNYPGRCTVGRPQRGSGVSADSLD